MKDLARPKGSESSETGISEANDDILDAINPRQERKSVGQKAGQVPSHGTGRSSTPLLGWSAPCRCRNEPPSNGRAAAAEQWFWKDQWLVKGARLSGSWSGR